MPKVALITGAAKRIGSQLVKHLHAKGFNIVLHYRESEHEANALANTLNQQRSNSVCCHQANLERTDSIKHLADKALSAWGSIDTLINNASDFFPTPIGSVTEDQWQQLIDSNLKGPFFLCQSLTPALKNSHGCIVNIIDIHAERPMKNHTVYCIAKAGLAMMTKSLAKELAPEVRVNGIAPGAILWPEQNQLNAQVQNDILQRVALDCNGTPEDIAQTALFLIEQAPYITGQILSVDGGRTIYQ